MIENNKSLHKEEFLLKILDENLDTGIYISDFETYEILYINQRLGNMFNKEKPENLIGRKCYEVFVQGAREQCPFCTKEKFPEDLTQTCVLEVYNDYLSSYLKSTDTLITWLDGRKAIFHNIIDITQEVENKNELLNREHQLENSILEANQASNAKSTFLSRMSHEIRTPLNAIIGMTTIAKTSDDIDKKDYCLNKIENASEHLLSIINNILDMSKIEANKLELVNDCFNLSTLLSDVNNIVSVKANEKSQNICIEVEKDVPSNYLGDSLRITQIITNLLFNAVKFSSDGTTSTLHVSSSPQDSDKVLLTFKIKDSGIGMSEENLNRLFLPFEQMDGGITRQYGGTGLGLSIVKSIVDVMDGEINAASTYGEGSTFTVTIPLLVVSDSECTGSDPILSTMIEDPDFSGKTILLVEDIEINREIVAELLKNTGLTIENAENGSVAVEIFTAFPNRYDLILMDVQMPIMDGYEATKIIRSIDPDIPIIAMTANAFREDVNRSLDSGMVDHITKPFNTLTLVQKIAQYIL